MVDAAQIVIAVVFMALGFAGFGLSYTGMGRLLARWFRHGPLVE